MSATRFTPAHLADLRSDIDAVIKRGGPDRAGAVIKVLAEFGLIPREAYDTWQRGFVDYAGALGWEAHHFDYLVLRPH
jgi:hypothetical protein